MSTITDVGAAEPARGPFASPADPPDGPLRASDAERTETVERLHQALGAGRLDLAETDERVATAYAARHRHELAALLTDLPRTDAVLGEAPSWTALWTLAVWRARIHLTGGTTPRPTSRQRRTAALLVAVLVGLGGVGGAVLGELGAAHPGPAFEVWHGHGHHDGGGGPGAPSER